MTTLEELKQLANHANFRDTTGQMVFHTICEQADFSALLAEMERLMDKCKESQEDADSQRKLRSLLGSEFVSAELLEAANQRAEADAQEIARLRSIVDKLPKTADGVPVVPGMELFFSDHSGNGSVAECRTCFAWEKRKHTNSAGPYPEYVQERTCFTTREAAEAAARKEGKL